MSRSVGLKVRLMQYLAFLEDISDGSLICQHCTAIVLKAVMGLDMSDISVSH